MIAIMHEGDGHMMTGWMSGWMPLWAVLALALVVLSVVAAVRLVRQPPRGSSSRDVLDRRYAAGEIGREEFLQRREDLTRP